MKLKKYLSSLSALAIVLMYSCSGGSTENTDTEESAEMAVDEVEETTADENAISQPEPFSKNLSLQGYDFEVKADNSGEFSMITITASGLESSDPMIMEAEGDVRNAEIEDLDSDGYPEVVLYSFSGDNDYGHVYGVTVLSGKSLGMLALPQESMDSEVMQGYEGHDEFTLIETYLGRRFPIYENGNDTGKLRDISYKLQPGETGKVFVLHQVNEY
jgi:hypothetical protein